MLLIGYFEGLDAERAIVWRAADSFALREFLGLVLPDAPPVHVCGFNLGLLLRQVIGVGTPRALQGRVIAALGALLALIRTLCRRQTQHWPPLPLFSMAERVSFTRRNTAQIDPTEMAFTTGC